jgi:hypothetical protein
LQSLVDAAPAGSTLALLRGEYQGPLIINKPCIWTGAML